MCFGFKIKAGHGKVSKLLQPGNWSLLRSLVGEMLAFAAMICFDILPVFDHKIEGSVAEIPSASVTVVST